MARVIDATSQNVKIRATQREISAFIASGRSAKLIQKDAGVILLTQGQFIAAFGRTGRSGQQFDIFSGQFVKQVEPEPEREKITPTEAKERIRAGIEVLPKAEPIIVPFKRDPDLPKTIDIKIPPDVLRGERELPIFDVFQDGKLIPSGGGLLDIEFVPRPTIFKKTPALGTIEFVTREEARREKLAADIIFERRAAAVPLEEAIIGGFEKLRPGRPPTGPEFVIEQFTIGAALALPALPSLAFSLVSRGPIETGRLAIESFIQEPVKGAARFAGGALVFGGIGRGLGLIKTPTPAVSIEFGKSLGFQLRGKPASFTISKAIIRVGRRKFAAVGKALGVETVTGETLVAARAAVAKFKVKGKPKAELFDIAAVGKEVFRVGDFRAGVFKGAFRSLKRKDVFAGKFVTKQRGILTDIITISKARRGPITFGAGIIEEIRLPGLTAADTPSFLKPLKLAKPTKPSLQQAALIKVFTEAPIIKRAVRLAKIEAVIPSTVLAAVRGPKPITSPLELAPRGRVSPLALDFDIFLKMPDLKKDVIGTKALFDTKQLERQLLDFKIKTISRTREKELLKFREKTLERVDTRVFQAPFIGQGLISGQVLGQQLQLKQRLRLETGLKLEQPKLRLPKLFVPRPSPAFRFALPRFPTEIITGRAARFDETQFRFRELENILGTPEQILGIKKKRLRKKKKRGAIKRKRTRKKKRRKR